MDPASLTLAALAAPAIAFTAVALASTSLLLRRAQRIPDATRWPSIVIVRPCEGREPDLLARLRSTLETDYPGALSLIVAHGGPPEAIASLGDDARVQLVQSPAAPPACNRKAWHLCSALETVQGTGAPSLVLAIDADVEITSALLRGLVRAASAPGVVASFGAPVQGGAAGWTTRIGHSALGASTHSFVTLSALASLTGDAPPMVGCAVAISRTALEAVGGFRSVLFVIGDDLSLGEALAAQGRVVLAPVLVDCRDPTLTLAGLHAQLSRWIRVATAHRPLRALSYPFLLAPLPMVLVAALCAWPSVGARTALAPIAVLYALRVLLAWQLRRAVLGRTMEALIDPWLADGAWWRAMAGALAPGPLQWRGRHYRLGARGAIAARTDEP